MPETRYTLRHEASPVADFGSFNGVTNPQTPLILRTRNRIRRVSRVFVCTWLKRASPETEGRLFVLCSRYRLMVDTTALIRRFRAASCSIQFCHGFCHPVSIARSAQCAGTSQSMCTPCVLENVTIPRSSPPLSAVSWYCACTRVPTLSLTLTALTGRGSVAETVDCPVWLAQVPSHQRTHHICKHSLQLCCNSLQHTPIPSDKARVTQDSGVSETCAAARGSISLLSLDNSSNGCVPLSMLSVGNGRRQHTAPRAQPISAISRHSPPFSSPSQPSQPIIAPAARLFPNARRSH
jgi:hypothetical protein